MELFSAEFVAALGAIILIDLVLAGDNAIVIHSGIGPGARVAMDAGPTAVQPTAPTPPAPTPFSRPLKGDDVCNLN